MGLLEGDGEWHESLREASRWAMPSSLRELFVTMLLFCQVSEPSVLWEKHREMLADDILRIERQKCNSHDLVFSDEEIFNYALYEIEKIMNRLGRSLKEIEGMPYPDIESLVIEENSLVIEELNYDRRSLLVEHESLFAGLNEGQRIVYDQVITSTHSRTGGFFFVYGSGGTGKTYMWKTILARLRAEGKIAIAVATSGIAALLLAGGKTAHSRFKIPLMLDKDSFLNIKRSSPSAEVICRASLIIWDEAPMAHRHAFEALDRSLRDLMIVFDPEAGNKVFGGKMVVLGGDFRQILPVISRGTRGDVVVATICSSSLWSSCQVFTLSENMRLRNSSSLDIAWFSDWLLKLGEGLLPLERIDDDEEEPEWLKLPEMFLLPFVGDVIDSVIDSTYPDLLNRISDRDYLRERAILSPKNGDVDKVNDHIMTQLPGEGVIYHSADRISQTSENYEAHTELYPVEYLNSLEFSGVPNHKLELKVGVPIILMRNLNQSTGLCNGTRLIVTKLASRVIEAEILAGSNIGSRCLIPRIEMVPSDTKLPFNISRRQFPVRVCFAMTINKSQRQTFSRVGLYLPNPVFCHGQLYVAASRVTSPDGFRVFLKSDHPIKSTHTKNIVYREVFARVYDNGG